MRILSKEETNYIDEQIPLRTGLPLVLVMENVGRGIAEEIINSINSTNNKSASHVVFICGTGNNGADGLVAARQLLEYKIPSYVFIHGDILKGTDLFRTQYTACQSLGIKFVNSMKDIPWHSVGIVLEGLIGTGLTSDLRDPSQQLLEELHHWLTEYHIENLWAIDIPAGVQTNSGQVSKGTLTYTKTITFGASKLGMHLYPGTSYCGEISIKPLGVPWESIKLEPHVHTLDKDLVCKLYPIRPSNAHKGMNGHAHIIGGSESMIGAPIMAAEACVYTGAGKTTLHVPTDCILPVQCKVMPETMVQSFETNADLLLSLTDCTAMAIGPGLGRSKESESLLTSLVSSFEGPLVIDADGLYALHELRATKQYFIDRNRSVIMTPHIGEFARLTGQSIPYIQSHYVDMAREFSMAYNVTLVLKGIPSIIALPSGNIYINTLGNSGMGTGGMGDTLTGIIVSLLAQGMNEDTAAILGVYSHSASADFLHHTKPIGYTPSDVGKGIGYILKQLQV